ncbi:hypothetical protein D3C83_18010 [compost metagenome]
MNGPNANGSSEIGSVIERVSAPKKSGAAPRSTVARPIVAMITAMIGRPMSGRSTTRSRPKPKATMPSIATATPSQNGAPASTSMPATMNPASMTNSPCAKLIASVAL